MHLRRAVIANAMRNHSKSEAPIVFTNKKPIYTFETVTVKTFMKQRLKRLQSTNPFHLINIYTQWPLNWLRLIRRR